MNFITGEREEKKNLITFQQNNLLEYDYRSTFIYIIIPFEEHKNVENIDVYVRRVWSSTACQLNDTSNTN